MEALFCLQIKNLGSIQLYMHALIIMTILSCKYPSGSQDLPLKTIDKDKVLTDNGLNKIIINSKWVSKPFGDECIDSLVFFSEDSFSFDNNCGVLDSTFGIWKIVNDTLILEHIGSYYSIGTNEEINKMLWKAVFKKNEIVLVKAYYWNYLENNFHKEPYQLDEKLNKFVRVQ